MRINWRYPWNILSVLFICFGPAGCLLWLGVHEDWIARLVTSLSCLFASEIIGRRIGRKGLWTSTPKSLRDKVAFAVAAIVLLLFVFWPQQQQIEPIWLQIPFLLVGAVLYGCILYFGDTSESKWQMIFGDLFESPAKKDSPKPVALSANGDSHDRPD